MGVAPGCVSHASAPSMIPLPHRALDGSVRHNAEQPSPPTSFPSSQVSGPVTFPSPQIGTQRAPATGQYQPSSTVHVAEQPSPPLVLRSSQVSKPFRRPSPQIAIPEQTPVLQL